RAGRAGLCPRRAPRPRRPGRLVVHGPAGARRRAPPPSAGALRPAALVRPVRAVTTPQVRRVSLRPSDRERGDARCDRGWGAERRAAQTSHWRWEDYVPAPLRSFGFLAERAQAIVIARLFRLGVSASSRRP